MSEEIDVRKILDLLSECCEFDGELAPDTELLDSGILDSLGFIELLNALEDMGAEINPARVPRDCFSTPQKIAELCESALSLS